MNPRVAVIGAGGVGGYFGGRLAAAGVEVHFIARGRHLAALQRDGLRVRSVAGDLELPVSATDDPTTIGPCEIVLFCVKAYDTEGALTALRPLMGADTAVLSLQNGIDNEEKIAESVGARHVLGAAAYIFSHVGAPGVVEHTGGPASIVVGELDGPRGERVERLVATGRAAGIAIEASDDIRTVLWTKFAFICAMAGATATVRLPVGDVRSAPASRELMGRLVEEVAAVGRSEGAALPGDVADLLLRFADSLEPGGFSSLHDDLVAGRRMELDALHGEVLRRARSAGVAAPMTEAVYAVLQPWAIRQAP